MKQYLLALLLVCSSVPLFSYDQGCHYCEKINTNLADKYCDSAKTKQLTTELEACKNFRLFSPEKVEKKVLKSFHKAVNPLIAHPASFLNKRQKTGLIVAGICSALLIARALARKRTGVERLFS